MKRSFQLWKSKQPTNERRELYNQLNTPLGFAMFHGVFFACLKFIIDGKGIVGNEEVYHLPKKHE